MLERGTARSVLALAANANKTARTIREIFIGLALDSCAVLRTEFQLEQERSLKLARGLAAYSGDSKLPSYAARSEPVNL